VIQRLFATGPPLRGAAGLIRSDPEGAARRVEGAVDGSFAIRPAGASGTIVEWCAPVG
jgi:hypothetical protein